MALCQTLSRTSLPVLNWGVQNYDVFQIWPCQARVEGEDHLPCPAGQALLNAPLITIGFLGHSGTLLAHGQSVVHQDTQVFSAEFLSSRSPLSCIDACNYSFPGARLYSCSCWTSSLTNSPVCPDLVEWQHNLQVCQPFLPALYQQQTFWGRALPFCLGHW